MKLTGPCIHRMHYSAMLKAQGWRKLIPDEVLGLFVVAVLLWVTSPERRAFYLAVLCVGILIRIFYLLIRFEFLFHRYEVTEEEVAEFNLFSQKIKVIPWQIVRRITLRHLVIYDEEQVQQQRGMFVRVREASAQFYIIDAGAFDLKSVYVRQYNHPTVICLEKTPASEECITALAERYSIPVIEA